MGDLPVLVSRAVTSRRFVKGYKETKQNSLKLIEDELRNIAWNVREVIRRDRELRTAPADAAAELETLRVYVDGLTTPSKGPDLHYLLQLALTLK